LGRADICSAYTESLFTVVLFGAFVVVITGPAGEGQEQAAAVRLAVVGGTTILVITIQKGVVPRNHAESARTNRGGGAFVSVVTLGPFQA